MSDDLSADDLRRLDTLFERAADLDVEERAALVARECGANRALARELEHLLAGLDADDLLARARPTTPSLAGTHIGPYRLLERVGEGGMGEVYEAEQLEPVVRRVALKIVKPGFDSAEVVARFHAERQALARMKHPCVAQIHGGGTTESGRPYFVMEFVEGEPVTDYCDRHRLPTRARLQLFLDVCAGVQHAHQKGLLHRDLKPSNLLVAREQGQPQVKVIDFGVARATSGRLAERTLVTQLGQIVGTLGYMSPEQSDPTSTEIDTRSDVYSLGVVLYELVSGLLPFDRESMAALSFAELQRMLRERAPDTPSTRLRRQPDTATSIAPLHATEPRALIRQLSGDLDWICLKALEREPARRYASVSELAADVRRHLGHEPVSARRPSAIYAAGKFVRRHRVGASTAGVTMLALSTGLYGAVSARLDTVASQRVAEVLRPAGDMARLQRLVRSADQDLWPLAPELVDELESWLVEARDLESRTAGYVDDVARLRARALPRSAKDLQRENEQRAELERQRTALEGEVARALEGGAPPNLEKSIAWREQRVAELEAGLGLRSAWDFASDEDRFQHELLVELVAGLAQLADTDRGLMSEAGVSLEHGWSVPMRRELARDLHARSLGGTNAEVWAEACSSIRESPRYGGLEIGPQMGLVPLGPDPDTGLWEFAHLLSGEPAQRDAQGRLQPTPETGVVLVLLPGATFHMGATSDRSGGFNFDPGAIRFLESPAHEVDVPAFFMSKYELTRSQWRRATRVGWLQEDPSQDLLPAAAMDWTEAARVLRQLGLTLPDEEQWEYAARAGTQTVWYTGDDELSLQGHANLFDQTTAKEIPTWADQAAAGPPSIIDDGSKGIAPVGSYQPNPFGLHDVHGNVQEWCLNAPYSYEGLAVPGLADERMSRGGSARYNATYCRSARRFPAPVSFRYPTLGLRPALALVR